MELLSKHISCRHADDWESDRCLAKIKIVMLKLQH